MKSLCYLLTWKQDRQRPCSPSARGVSERVCMQFVGLPHRHSLRETRRRAMCRWQQLYWAQQQERSGLSQASSGCALTLGSSVSSDPCTVQAGWSTRAFSGACRHHPCFHRQGISFAFDVLERRKGWGSREFLFTKSNWNPPSKVKTYCLFRCDM